MSNMSELHPTAAEGFGRDADTYVRGRPDFPPAAFDWLRHDLGLGPGRTAIDLGAGTGKFTRLLVDTGATVIAIEPVAAMLERLTQDLPGVTALQGVAQRIPLPDSSADALVCAQAFHWFASRESLAEIRRVLKHGGVLGLIWNVRDESVDWVAQLTRIMQPYEGTAPRYYREEWRSVFPAPGLGELQKRTFTHVHSGAPEQVIVERVASVSFIAALDVATRSGVLDQVRALIKATPAIATAETVCLPYVTHAYTARRA
jgi:ubiquinone/menaquinone biosynthesis C-methylase UbiE